ncbi:serine carboxypeptidase-like 18 [Durio zibethinus]|uniref:Serine carboxypeptidase-like 18 n=1 Tax=Durio zibethinus TaxID=66656 RepID=A0A6P6AC84_DURZI|nr:serine carboxypeptidase-like 18 [Durio zibethinus]
MLSKNIISCQFLVHLLPLLLLLLSKHADSAGSIVETLPGYPGNLPFKLETGYIRVNESELFYLFVESEGKPRQDPLMLYLNGGPGCSALTGFFFQTGPLSFNTTDYSGGLPTLLLYPHTWTKSASIIFVDEPVGTGFSYSQNSEDYYISDTGSAHQLHLFIRKWLKEYPKFINNPFFIASDSYSGIIAPIVAQEIFDGNEGGMYPYINLLGIVSGSPHTDSKLEDNSKIPFACDMALISDSLYEAVKRDCNGNYIDVDVSNTACVEDLLAINKCVDDINNQDILLPKCDLALPYSNDEQRRRSLREASRKLPIPNSKTQDYFCKNFEYILSYIWANNETVQEALHVRKGTVKQWYRCNLTLAHETYIYSVASAIDYQRNLTERSMKVLLYSGDHDMVVPHISTEEWISTLKLTLDIDWRPWFVNGQVAGYTMKYSKNRYELTYATLKGAGHSPTEYKGKECYNMFERWIHRYPL